MSRPYLGALEEEALQEDLSAWLTEYRSASGDLHPANIVDFVIDWLSNRGLLADA